MRTFLLVLIAVFSNYILFGQSSDSLKTEKSLVDTTKIQLGDKEVKIIEEDGETIVIVDEDTEVIREPNNSDVSDNDWDYDKEWDFDWEKEKKRKRHGKFKGHWAGFEFGLNNYVDQNFSLVRTAESEFLDLNTGRSWNINVNFAQFSIPTIGNRFGFVTGLGFEWNNYHFSNPNSIIKDPITGSIQPLDISGTITKNRLQTMYLTIPLILELQILKGSRSDRIHLAGGVIGGLKLYSQTKYKLSENGGTRTEKDWSDYYLHPFRYGVTARAGYKLVKVYFNYYLTPLFIENRGPELFPVAMGLAITF